MSARDQVRARQEFAAARIAGDRGWPRLLSRKPELNAMLSEDWAIGSRLRTDSQP